MYKWRRLHEENYKHMKIVVGILEVSCPLHILFPLFGIPLLMYFCHSSQVICKILRLWHSDPLHPSIILQLQLKTLENICEGVHCLVKLHALGL